MAFINKDILRKGKQYFIIYNKFTVELVWLAMVINKALISRMLQTTKQ